MASLILHAADSHNIQVLSANPLQISLPLCRLRLQHNIHALLLAAGTTGTCRKQPHEVLAANPLQLLHRCRCADSVFSIIFILLLAAGTATSSYKQK